MPTNGVLIAEMTPNNVSRAYPVVIFTDHFSDQDKAFGLTHVCLSVCVTGQ